MTGAINTVVFDLGGVLFDWNPEYLYRDLIPDDAERQAFMTQVCTREWPERHDEGVSFADADNFPQARQCFPALAYFKDIVVSGVEKIKKPDPRCWIYIDDRAANLAAALRRFGALPLQRCA